jgi:hypothetical protein
MFCTELLEPGKLTGFFIPLFLSSGFSYGFSFKVIKSPQ